MVLEVADFYLPSKQLQKNKHPSFLPLLRRRRLFRLLLHHRAKVLLEALVHPVRHQALLLARLLLLRLTHTLAVILGQVLLVRHQQHPDVLQVRPRFGVEQLQHLADAVEQTVRRLLLRGEFELQEGLFQLGADWDRLFALVHERFDRLGGDLEGGVWWLVADS